jgi:phosphoglycolate phosphatase-like HAD superfamily hydrolase
LEQIVPTHTISPPDIDLDTLLQSYAAQVRHGLLNCQVAESLQLLRERTPESRWLIVSGGDQTELREVFATRGLADLFDGGIFGSPDTKDQILAREIQNGNIENPALFFGDSKYDYQAATTAGLDFLFISSWSEVTDWDKWCHEQKIPNESNISKIVSQLTASIKIFNTK